MAMIAKIPKDKFLTQTGGKILSLLTLGKFIHHSKKL
jgi:hypothetical protein